jgi:hypothetical protein
MSTNAFKLQAFVLITERTLTLIQDENHISQQTLLINRLYSKSHFKYHHITDYQ